MELPKQQGRYVNEESFRLLLQRAVIFPLILAIGMAAIFLWQVRSLLQVNRWVEEGDRIISRAEHLQRSVIDSETRLRGYILLGSPEYLDFFQKAKVELPLEFAELKKLVGENPVQLAQLDDAEQLMRDWFGTAQEALERRMMAGSLQNFRPTGQGRPKMAKIREILRVFTEEETKIRDERSSSARQTSRLVMFFGMGMAVLLGLILAIFSRRTLFSLSSNYQDAFLSLDAKTRQLELSETRFRHLADAIPQIVWTARVGGKGVEYVNQRWFEYTGDMPMEDWSAVIHPDDFPAALAALKEAGQNKTAYQAEYRIRRADNVYRWHLGRAVLVPDEQGELTIWFGTATDIEEHKRAQAAVEKAVTTRDEFISIASHELKTPLTSLKLQLQMGRKSLRTEPGLETGIVGKAIAFSLVQVDRLTALVERLLDISRIQAGKLQYEMELIDFSSLVRDLAERFRPDLEEGGSTLTVEVEEGIEIRCDHFRMEQVIVNLLTNALKYGPGTPVKVSLKKMGRDICLKVRDGGVGVPLHLQSLIFERFQRGHSPQTVDGIGLGLYIAKEIVSAHGGRIEVESDGRRGATFRVHLPSGV